MERKRISRRSELVRDVDGLYVISTQHFDGLLEYNAHQRGEQRGAPRTWTHIAEIPNNLMSELTQRFGQPKNNPTDWKRWLNDPDNYAFRTWHGKI